MKATQKQAHRQKLSFSVCALFYQLTLALYLMVRLQHNIENNEEAAFGFIDRAIFTELYLEDD